MPESLVNAPPVETPPAETPPAETPPAETPPILTPEEQKVADDKAAVEKQEAEDKEKAEHAPENYEDFKLPEGVEMDKDTLEKFLPLAKELDLSQEKAQKLVDFQAEIIQGESERQWDNWEKVQEEWVSDSKSDKEIGGEKFQENLAAAKKPLDAYGNDALKDLADATGMGNNKEFIRFLVNIAKDMSEDKLKVGGSRTQAGDRASRIYDKK